MTSATEKLRIQFRKGLGKGYVNNATIDPLLSSAVRDAVEPNESFIVRIDARRGGHYWFSDRRALHETAEGVNELFRYAALKGAHWISKELWANPMKFVGQIANLKREQYDRLEIELQGGIVVLEGLDQSYWPVLHFFWWMLRTTNPDTAEGWSKAK